MTYSEKRQVLESVRSSVDVVYHQQCMGSCGVTWAYALVTDPSGSLPQDSFPAGCTVSVVGTDSYIVSMYGDLEDDEEIAEALQACGSYDGQ